MKDMPHDKRNNASKEPISQLKLLSLLGRGYISWSQTRKYALLFPILQSQNLKYWKRLIPGSDMGQSSAICNDICLGQNGGSVKVLWRPVISFIKLLYARVDLIG